MIGARTHGALRTSAQAQVPSAKLRRTEQTAESSSGLSRSHMTSTEDDCRGASGGASSAGRAPVRAPVRTPVKVEPTEASTGAAEAADVAAEEAAAYAPLPCTEDEALYDSIYGAWEDDEDVAI